MKQKIHEHLVEGAKVYAQFDKTDPFTLQRAMTHIRVGLVNSSDDGYSAMPTIEGESYYDTKGNRVDFPVTRFKNVQRP